MSGNKSDLMFVSNLNDMDLKDVSADMASVFETLDANFRLTNLSMFIIDFAKNKMIYRTKDLLFTDEATCRDVQRESLNPYWALMREDDLDVMLETRKAYFDLIDSFTIEQKLNHTYIIDYRIFLKHREYTVAQKFTPLKLKPDGKLWMGLFCIATSPHQTCEHIAIFGDGFRFTYDFQKKQFLPFMEKMELSLMEKAILLRASKGLSTEQIAEDLCKSVNTIKTHKRRLFGKLHVTSMNEAITFVQNYSLY